MKPTGTMLQVKWELIQGQFPVWVKESFSLYDWKEMWRQTQIF